MRILSLRPGHEEKDQVDCQAMLLAEIQRPGKITMVIRGNGPAIEQFADRANDRAMSVPWRSVVWVQDGRIFDDDQELDLFGDSSCCAVVLNLAGQSAATLVSTATLLAIDEAFNAAEGGS